MPCKLYIRRWGIYVVCSREAATLVFRPNDGDKVVWGFPSIDGISPI